MTNTDTAPKFIDIRHTTPEHKKTEYRVFVEVDGKVIVVAYKKSLRAAKMAFNKLGQQDGTQHAVPLSYGWETRDRFNEHRW